MQPWSITNSVVKHQIEKQPRYRGCFSCVVLQNCAKISGLNYTRYPLSPFFGKANALIRPTRANIQHKNQGSKNFPDFVIYLNFIK